MDPQALETPPGRSPAHLQLAVWSRTVIKSQAGLSALDILIAACVLSALLFAAAKQFHTYEGLSAQPAVQSAETEE